MKQNSAATAAPQTTVIPAQDLDNAAALYNAEYYRKGCGPVPYDRSQPHWAMFFGEIATQLIKSLRPRRVLDAGCAMGFLVEAFWDRGIEAWGIDISHYAIENVRRDMRPYCRQGSISRDIEGRYDLITCIEVVEHLPETEALEALKLICQATETVLFSSTPSDLEEPTHYNVRPLIYWLKAFQQCGFSPDLQFDASFVSPQAMLLRRTEPPLALEVLQTFASLLHVRCRIAEKDRDCQEAAAAKQQAEARANEQIAQLTQANLQEFDRVRRESAAEVAQAEARANEQIAQLTQAHLQEFDRVRRESAAEVAQALASLRAETAATLRDAEARFTGEISRMTQQNTEALERLRSDLDCERRQNAEREDEQQNRLAELQRALQQESQTKAEMAGEFQNQVTDLRRELDREQRNNTETAQQLSGQISQLGEACRMAREEAVGAEGLITGLQERVNTLAGKLTAAESNSLLLYDKQREFEKGIGDLENRLDANTRIEADREARLAQQKAALGTLQPRLNTLENGAQRTAEEVRRMDRSIAMLGQQVASLNAATQSVLNSRIWRTLVKSGGMLLRCGSLFRFGR